MLAYVFLFFVDETAWPWADHDDDGVVHGEVEVCGGDGIVRLQDEDSDVHAGSGGDLDIFGSVGQVPVDEGQDVLGD